MHLLLSQIDTYIILSKTQLHFKWYASSPQTHPFSASFMTLVCTERPEIGRCWGDSLESMAALMLFNWQEPSCGIKDNSVGTVYLWCLFTSHSHSFFLPLLCRGGLVLARLLAACVAWKGNETGSAEAYKVLVGTGATVTNTRASPT